MTEMRSDAALGIGAQWCVAGADFEAQARTLTIRVDSAPGHSARPRVYRQPRREIRRALLPIAGKRDSSALKPRTTRQEGQARSNGALRCAAITPLNPEGAMGYRRDGVTFLACTLQNSSHVLPCEEQGSFARHTRWGRHRFRIRTEYAFRPRRLGGRGPVRGQYEYRATRMHRAKRMNCRDGTISTRCITLLLEGWHELCSLNVNRSEGGAFLAYARLSGGITI